MNFAKDSFLKSLKIQQSPKTYEFLKMHKCLSKDFVCFESIFSLEEFAIHLKTVELTFTICLKNDA